MPQVGFGQSNPSPQYGGVPNQNAFMNANPAANLYSRFGAPSDGAPSPLPGGAPTPLTLPQMARPTPMSGYGWPNFMAMRNANPYADLMNRFGGGMNYLPFMPYGYGMGYQNALAAQPNYNFLAPR